MKVVSNSGPLMALGKIGQIHLLYPVYGTILIPAAADTESTERNLSRGSLISSSGFGTSMALILVTMGLSLPPTTIRSSFCRLPS